MRHLLSHTLLPLTLWTISFTFGEFRAAAQTATSTTVVSSANPSIIGQAVTYTVTVTASGPTPPTGPVQINVNGNFNSLLPLVNGIATTADTFSGPPRTVQIVALYLGDANTAPSSSAPLNQVVNAGLGLAPTTISVANSTNPAYVGQTITYTATVSGGGTTPPTGTVSFFFGSTVPTTTTLDNTGTAVATNSFPTAGNYAITASYSGDSNNAAASSTAIGQEILEAAAQPPLQLIPVPPCRIADTRNAVGPFGGPAVPPGQTRSFAIPQSACGIPSTAAAYSLNVTAIPGGPLNYLTVWPTGQPVPTVSLLNSLDGRVKANATIVPAGTSGAISVYANAGTSTGVVIDIDGYFAPSTASTLAFYSVTPCRIADTRNATGPLGGPYLSARQSRVFPVLSSNCQIPATAKAYSLNVTAIPAGPLNYLTIWPTGQAQPTVSTLNATTGTITANAAIVPAGTSGAVSVFVTNDADLLLDVNGYFAPPGVGGTSLYTTTPCRVFDSRLAAPFPPFPGTQLLSVQAGPCPVSNAASAYVLNATILPYLSGPVEYLTLWPAGTSRPVVSTLNAIDGSITSNMAIVTDSDGVIDTYSPSAANLLLDISSYFAP